jgi:hypothetical protein
MTGFEFLFTFYSLLLGIAIANIATDFADIWRERHSRMAGTSTIMLGLFILLCVAQQWIAFWDSRDILEMGPTNLLVCIAMAFPYIFVSQAMFPSKQDNCASLDDYYIAHNRVLLGVLLIPVLVSLGYNLIWGGILDLPNISFFIIRIGIPLLLIFFQNQWLHRIGLGVLILTISVRIYS